MCKKETAVKDTSTVSVEVKSRILSRNDEVAAHNREHFRERGIFAINLMGSPGSGKTAVLEATARALSGAKVAAVAGDLATENDSDRITKAGIRSRAITTGTACHLDAEMVHRALHDFNLDGVKYFFIENVGNLVCPAVYDLGQAVNVVALSVTEGEDKPVKYPTMFAKADLVLITKIDLLMYLPKVNVNRIEDAIAKVMPNPRIISMSAEEGFGVNNWIDWVTAQ